MLTSPHRYIYQIAIDNFTTMGGECHWAAVIELVCVISHARDSPEPLSSIKVDMSSLILQFIAKRQTRRNKYLKQPLAPATT